MRTVPRWLFLWSLAGLVFLSGVALKCYLPAHGLFDVTGYLIGRDFVNVWMAAHLLDANAIADAYDIHAFVRHLREVFGGDFPFHNWSYPPSILLLILPFGQLSYEAGLVLWTLLGLAVFLLALRIPENRAPFLISLLLLVSAPASLVNMMSGQNGFFTAACFLGGFYLLKPHPIVAGILFGLLTVKPQLGLLVPFALILLGQWRTITSATVTTLLLAIFSIAVWGVGLWQSYLHTVVSYQYELLATFKGFYTAMMPGSYAAARIVGLSQSMAIAIHATGAFVAIVAAFSILLREGTTPRAVLALAITAFLVTPYGYNYDLTAVTGALFVYLCDYPPVDLRERLLYGALWLLPAASFAIMFAHLPLAPLVMLGTLLYLAQRSASA